MKENVYFVALFLCNLALITHNAPYGVNSSTGWNLLIIELASKYSEIGEMVFL